ncbi:helix-turn-helix domain-containing protein, partial [Herpetosiphon sp.]
MDHQTRRSAVLRLHLEGWPTKRIAAYLQTSRQTVHTIVTRFRSEDLAMLYPRSRARKPGARVVTTEGVAAIQQLRANPRLGAFRIRAALKQQQGIVYSRRTINRVLARLRALDPPPAKPPTTPAQPMPFAAATAHAVWSVDIRYLDM